MSVNREGSSPSEALAVARSELQPVPPHGLAHHCSWPPGAGTPRPCLRETWQLPGRSERTPHQARALVGETCRRWHVARRVVAELLLIVSERVTVAVLLTTGDVWVAVVDQGPRRPLHSHLPDADDEHGRGLVLVAALADRHEAQPAGGGTAVWACLTLPTPRPLSDSSTSAVHATARDGAHCPHHTEDSPDAPRSHI